MIKATYSRRLQQDYNFRALESMDITVGSIVVDRHDTGTVAGSLDLIHKHKAQREHAREWHGFLKPQSSPPSDTPPSNPSQTVPPTGYSSI